MSTVDPRRATEGGGPAEEPVAISGALMAVIVAAFGVAVLFGVPLTPEQVGGCVTFAGAVIGLVTVYQRSQVVSVAKARRALTAESQALLDIEPM